MAIFKTVLYVLVVLIFIVFGLVFSFRNQSLINVDLLFIEIASFSAGFWVLGSLLAGVVLGLFLALPRRISQALKIRVLSKKVSVSSNSAPSARTKIEPSKGH